ncbi:MAG: BTAD domain-containing putative transcriptional regulator [Caldilineaceae bacterium]
MEPIRISMFGALRVQRHNLDLAGFEARKVQELLCYLLLHRAQAHNRERLASLFWGNQTTANSRKYLRQTLWQLQSALDKQEAPGGPLLLADDECIQVNPAAEMWLDVAVLEDAFVPVQQIPGAQLSEAQTACLEDAVGVYQADLLEGWYLDWCIFERERLQSMYLGALDKLVSGCEARQDFGKGIVHASAILRCDRARERTYRHMMRMHYFAGDRTQALRDYETCVAALQDELSVDPARSTVALYEEIRDDHLNAAHLSGVPASQPAFTQLQEAPREAAGLGELLHTLGSLQEGIKLLEGQVTNCMRAIERTLGS